jgi:hypothetical protein
VAVLVDEAVWPWRGRRWAHLVSDSSYEELHAFADRLGIPPGAFQGDHYDVPTEMRDAAVLLGAEAVPGRELVVRLRAAGLRRHPRRASGGPDAGRIRPPTYQGERCYVDSPRNEGAG